MLKIGVTGGIGSGKTTVCKIFASIGVPVYYADYHAKRLMSYNKSLKSAIKDLLGIEVYHPNGRLNRKKVANKIFNDKNLLTGINQLVHPAVKHDADQWFSQQKGKYGLYEAALLVENESYKDMDQLIVVTAPEATRIARVVKRDKSNIELVKKRIKNQLPESKKIAVADYIIDNGGSLSLIPQIIELHRVFSSQSS